MSKSTGGCQCGGVRYEINGEPLVLVACHCTECQRQSGSAFGMSLVTPKEIFRITAGAPRSFKRPADSGGTVECVFCPDCGTRIFHRPEKLVETVNVKPGTLDDRSNLSPAFHIWVSKKQEWFAIPENAKCFDENPG